MYSDALSSFSEPLDILFILITLWASQTAADRIDTAIASCPMVRPEPPSRPLE